MANQKKPPEKTAQPQSPLSVMAIGAVCLAVGLAVGYYFGRQTSPTTVTGGSAGQGQGSDGGSTANLVDPAVIQQNEARLKSALASNPSDSKTLIQLGNL